MSDFYSRCLSCGVDLPRGCRFCGEYCRDQWHAKHEGEAVAIVATDEWPLVRRETMVSGAMRVASTASQPAVEKSRRDGTEGLVPAVALPPSRTHGPYCGCKHCRVDVI